jgi:carboxylesterase type B
MTSSPAPLSPLSPPPLLLGRYVAPASNHLFHSAVSESGGLYSDELGPAVNQTNQMAAKLGCSVPASTLGLAGHHPSASASASASSSDGTQPAPRMVANKTCMQHLAGLKVTSLTYAGDWGPVTDFVTFPDAPQRLLQEGKVNDAAVILGLNTNDSMLFVAQVHRPWGVCRGGGYYQNTTRTRLNLPALFVATS